MRYATGFDTKGTYVLHVDGMTSQPEAQHKNIQSDEQSSGQTMCCFNTTENTTFLYDYDYNFTSAEDWSFQVPVLYYIPFFLGLLGNTTVLWILLRHIKLKRMTDICLLNLALSDFLLAVSLPLWACGSQNLASCKLMTGIYQLGFYSGTLFVTLMSVDRYLAIVHAVAFMQAQTLRYGIIASIMIWFISIIMATPQVIFASMERYKDGNSNLRCQPMYPNTWQNFWKMQRNFSENIVSLFLCLPIMIFCYMKILFVLSKMRNSNNSKKDRALKLIFIIVCVFIVCWVPYNVMVFLQTLQLFGILNTCQALRAINSSMNVSEIIALSHCCVNPVIYAFVGEKFRKPLGNIVTRYLCCRSSQSRGTFSQRDTTEKETSNTAVRSDY